MENESQQKSAWQRPELIELGIGQTDFRKLPLGGETISYGPDAS